ncbi:MAG: potassium channel protein [Cyclobacteriaceae bacterium]
MELADLLRRLKLAGLAFLTIMAIGIVGYSYIGNASWLDAFYMTSITIATIGFREVIDLNNSPAGKIFTIFLAFSGIGVFTYFLSNLSALFIEGDLRKSYYKIKRMKKINKMEGHYIISGCGRVGRNIALELFDTERNFVITDIDQKVLEKFIPEIPETPFVSGDSTNDEFLESLNIGKAAGIFVCAKDDNTNLVICITARQLNQHIRIITRITDVAHTSKMRRAGANSIVSPNYIGGLRMASEMVRPTVASFIKDMVTMSDGEVTHHLRMEEIEISEKFDGKKVEELPTNGCDATLVLAVKTQGGWLYNPKKDIKLSTGDYIVLMTTPKEHKLIASRL